MWNMNVYIPTSEANVHAVERKEQIIVWERSRAPKVTMVERCVSRWDPNGYKF